jgi:GT2 family glycosyltransferase
VKLSIVYVNYNTTELLVASLRSLKRLAGLEYEVLVVDNASKDFDEAAVKAVAPAAKIVRSAENLGFGRGNNLGAAEARGEYLWILNTDTLVPEGNGLDKLVRFLDGHREYGAALPLLKDDTGVVQPTQVAYFPTPAKILLNVPVRVAAKLLPGLRRLYARVNLDYAPVETRDVEVAVAAAIVVRREVYEQVGGFSPEFFMFYEDSDLCRKIWKAGHGIRWMTEATTVHLWGQSIRGKRSFSKRKELYFRSQDIYLRKWHSKTGQVLVKCLRWPLVLRYRLFNR